MTIKNSQNSPLQIAQVLLEPAMGVLGLTLCPGKKDSASNWNRDLAQDLQVIRDWGAAMVVTLIEDHEFQMLAVQTLERDVRALGMVWLHLPILDVSIPDHRFEDAWVLEGPKLHKLLDRGDRILIHCRGVHEFCRVVTPSAPNASVK
jgi:ADP-ribosyl-[dinitrogen reductase] hydrolase